MRKETEMNVQNHNRVLVTGAAGFVGSHLCETLIKKGSEVVGLIGPECDTRWIENLDMTLIRGDLTDKKSLLKAVSGINCVYHLAGMLGGSKNEKIFKTNYEGTKNLVDACLENGTKVDRFLFVSSHAVMGPTPKDKLYNEDMECRPVSDYGKSKLLAEQYIQNIDGQLPHTIVRMPIVFGPRSFRGLFSVYQLLGKRLHFNFGKGECNVGFIQDMVDAIIEASQSQKTVGKAYFIGEKKIYSLNEIFAAIQKTVGKKAVKIKVPYFIAYLFAVSSELYAKMNGGQALLFRKDFKYPFWRMDVSNAEKDFGFKTKVPFEEGLKITADWYRENGFL